MRDVRGIDVALIIRAVMYALVRHVCRGQKRWAVKPLPPVGHSGSGMIANLTHRPRDLLAPG